MQGYVTEREILKESVQRGEEELQRAVEDLKEVVNRPLAIIERLTATALPWILSGLLIGFWLGNTRSGSARDR